MNLNNAQFDLNIANYKISELEQLLELPSNYDETIIEMKEDKLKQNKHISLLHKYLQLPPKLQFISNILYYFIFM